MEFLGFEREDGEVGVRNYIAVIPTVGCANEVAEEIARRVSGCKALLHHQGCCHIPSDLETVERVLIGWGRNPNVSAVLLISLGCENVSVDRIYKEISKFRRHVEKIVIQENGYRKSVDNGVKIARKLVESAKESKRESFDLSKLIIGVKCGASDTTSGIASNPAVGKAVDKIIDMGGTVVFGEITEVIGAEHILAKRAVSKEVSEKILDVVQELEMKVKSLGIDLRGCNPTLGNIKGGLSTIEEKSLGAIVKSGSSKIKDVLKYGEKPAGNGLYMMMSPGREIEFLTGLIAGGAQTVLFSTGIGAPQGYPIAPVIKICGNPKTCSTLYEHIDVDVSEIITKGISIDEASERILEKIIRVASGEKTKAELIGYDRTVDIYIRGMVL
jgi:altronate dehydratase large subunit